MVAEKLINLEPLTQAYKSLNRNWRLLAIASVLAITLEFLYFIYCAIPWHKMGVAEWAYWVGALGSIGSIAGAYFLGERQAKAVLRTAKNADILAAHRKGKAVLAVTDAAQSNTSGVMEAFDGDHFSYLGLVLKYDASIMSSIIAALEAIPVHELGSYKAVAALLRIRTSMAHFQKHVKRCLETVERTQNSGGVSNWHVLPFDSAAIKICMEEIVKCNKVLAEEVNQMISP